MVYNDNYEMTEKRKPGYNRRLAKKRVQCLNEVLCFVSSSVLADSFRLRNPLLRQAPKRYLQCYEKTAQNTEYENFNNFIFTFYKLLFFAN